MFFFFFYIIYSIKHNFEKNINITKYMYNNNNLIYTHGQREETENKAHLD